MVKFTWGCICLFILCSFSANAQKTDSVKRDSAKIDTNLLNRYRIEPPKNAIPVSVRPLLIQPEYIPVAMLDYKVSYWHKLITFALNFNQSAFTNNYSAGGVNAIALNTNFDFKAEYNKAPFDYANETNFIYGIAKNKGQGARKSNDRIFFDNKVSSQISKHWFYFGSFTFESQFAQGYQYNTVTDATGATINQQQLISNFMAPGYFTESAGFEYKPSKFFDLRLGVLTARQTFVVDTTIYHYITGNYGVTPGQTFENNVAAQIVSTFDKDVMKNMHLNVRYALFIPYNLPLRYTTDRVDATLIAKVNNLFSVTINGTFLYDITTSQQAQGTEGIALGVIYKFP